MKSVKRTLRLLKYNFKEIILFEIIYRLAAAMIFLSIFSRGIEFAVKSSGYSYLTAKNIGNFLFKPVSILVLFGILIVGILLILFETNTLLAVYQASERGEKLTIWVLIGRGILKMKLLFQRRNRAVIFVHLVTVALLNYDFIYRGVQHVKPMNDIVKNIKMIPWLYYSIIGLLIIAVLFIIPHIFVLHVCILTKKQEISQKKYYLDIDTDCGIQYNFMAICQRNFIWADISGSVYQRYFCRSFYQLGIIFNYI